MKNNERYFLDIYAIQTLPPSNINRDDTGSPKTAQYGGVRRARVSSQARKKAMRDYFKDHGKVANVGVRTLHLVDYLAGKIMEKAPDMEKTDAIKLADDTLNKAGISTKNTSGDKKNPVYLAKALFFLGESQAENLAKAAVNGVTDKNELKEIIKENPAVDIALFGRMLADDPSLNEDASAQVAHAISTHRAETEFDFYTAVDDKAPEDNAGAGMLGTLEFNSSTLYRYANVAVHEFLRQMGDKEATINALKLFVESFVKSLPTGHVNSYANQTIPQAVLVTLRDDRPVNLVTAYENPVKSKDGYVDASIDRLFSESKKVEKFVDKPIFSLYLTLDDKEGGYGEKKESFENLIESLGEKLGEILENPEA